MMIVLLESLSSSSSLAIDLSVEELEGAEDVDGVAVEAFVIVVSVVVDSTVSILSQYVKLIVNVWAYKLCTKCLCELALLFWYVLPSYS